MTLITIYIYLFDVYFNIILLFAVQSPWFSKCYFDDGTVCYGSLNMFPE